MDGSPERPGVALRTLGPGALNLVTGAAYGFLGGMPMVLITGQKAIRQSRQAHFQIVDIVAAMRPLTKQSQQIVSASSIPTLVRNAFRIAAEERPGPVHLELPEDIAGERGRRCRRWCRRMPLELPVRIAGSDRARLRIDPGGQISAADVRRRRKPASIGAGAVRIRASCPHPLLQHADGEGRGRGRFGFLSRHRRPERTRLCSPGDRSRRSDRDHRPRHG